MGAAKECSSRSPARQAPGMGWRRRPSAIVVGSAGAAVPLGQGRSPDVLWEVDVEPEGPGWGRTRAGS